MKSAADLPTSPWPRRTKRGVDLIVGAVLALLTAPLMLVLALIVRVESSGPVFVVHPTAGVQRRRPRQGGTAGRRVHDAGGALFGLVSFRVRVWTRSRRHGAPAPLTRVGGWLRRTGLERLPQLLHVLTGELTLVGPRTLSPRWAVRLNEEVPLYADVMLGVVPGWIGPTRGRDASGVERASTRAAGAQDPLLATLVERVLHDLPYALALRQVTTPWGVLGLDLATLRRGLQSRSWARHSTGNEVVVLEHARHFAQLPLDAQDLAEHRPRGMGSDFHEHDGLLTTWWYPARAGAPGRQEPPAELFTRDWCESHHEFDPAELVLTKLLQPTPGGSDALKVELPCSLQGLGAVCEHLLPLWQALQWRCQEEHLGIKQSLVLLEGAARLAARPGAPDDRIALTIEVAADAVRLRLTRRAFADVTGARPFRQVSGFGSPAPGATQPQHGLKAGAPA